MSNKKSLLQQIFFSIIMSVAIIFLLGYICVQYLIPIFNIQTQTLYKVMIYAFPILIGLSLIEIASVIANKNGEDKESRVDALPKNSYDSPLYTLPEDDPAFEEGIRYEAEKTIEPFQAAEMQTPRAEETNETQENESLSHEDDAADKLPPELKNLSSNQITNILDYLKNGGVAPLVPVQSEESTTAEPILSFDNALANELEESISCGYDLTICLFSLPDEASEESKRLLLNSSNNAAFSYTLEDGLICLIFPFFNTNETRLYLKEFLEQNKEAFSDIAYYYGYSSREERRIDASIMLDEARTNLSQNRDNILFQEENEAVDASAFETQEIGSSPTTDTPLT